MSAADRVGATGSALNRGQESLMSSSHCFDCVRSYQDCRNLFARYYISIIVSHSMPRLLIVVLLFSPSAKLGLAARCGREG